MELFRTSLPPGEIVIEVTDHRAELIVHVDRSGFDSWHAHEENMKYAMQGQNDPLIDTVMNSLELCDIEINLFSDVPVYRFDDNLLFLLAGLVTNDSELQKEWDKQMR